MTEAVGRMGGMTAADLAMVEDLPAVDLVMEVALVVEADLVTAVGLAAADLAAVADLAAEADLVMEADGKLGRYGIWFDRLRISMQVRRFLNAFQGLSGLD